MLAGSFGLLNCLGLCGGFLGPFILGAFEDRTGAATSGLWFAVALLIIGALVSLFLKVPHPGLRIGETGPRRKSVIRRPLCALKCYWI